MASGQRSSELHDDRPGGGRRRAPPRHCHARSPNCGRYPRAAPRRRRRRRSSRLAAVDLRGDALRPDQVRRPDRADQGVVGAVGQSDRLQPRTNPCCLRETSWPRSGSLIPGPLDDSVAGSAPEDSVQLSPCRLACPSNPLCRAQSGRQVRRSISPRGRDARSVRTTKELAEQSSPAGRARRSAEVAIGTAICR
jgi:hypothetical protein